jgi:hypothetical protein
MSVVDPIPAGLAAPLAAPEDEALRCPLCEYDLRGLVEPRCPECGYRFSWEELRDPARRLHRYLFEHHPERNLWSLWRTFWGGLRPRRFWGELLPTQPSRPKRLLLYWLILAGLCALPYAVYFGRIVVEVDQYSQNWRPKVVAQWSAADRAAMAAQYGSVQAALDAMFPQLPSPRVVARALQWGAGSSILLPGLITLVWPWLTVAALMVFQASMRRAKVRPVHVLRCVIYSADACCLATACMVGAVVYAEWLAARAGYIGIYQAVELTLWITLGLMLLLTYRLWVAYRKYLRFDHALATVVASQVMVGLLVLKFALDWRIVR